MNLVDELHRVTGALHAGSVRYAVCGGIAVTIHGATRSTKDIDLLIARVDVPAALAAVRPLGFEYPALPMTFDAGTERARSIQRVSKLEGGEHLIVDFILAEGPFAGMLDRAVIISLPEGPLRVLDRETLLAMKRLAARAQDLADIEKLERPEP